MGFRVVMIEEGEQLKSKLDNLYIRKGGLEYTIPLSDISIVIVGNLNATITARLLSELALNNIVLVTCDRKHQPIGIYTGINTHSRSSKVLKTQLSWNDEFKDDIWKEIIKSKITNQRNLLKKLDKNNEAINLLTKYIEEIKTGDKTNREGHAAKVYFNSLFGIDFTRDDDILINNCLNYIYTITRSFFAKLVVAYGFTGALGVHHRNEYNSFNLVDDLMEPFRPICDEYVVNLLENIKLFDINTRIKLVDFLNYEIKYKNKIMKISSVADIYVQGFMRSSQNNELGLIQYPEVKSE